MTSETIIALFVGLVAGAAITAIVMRATGSAQLMAATSEATMLRERVAALQSTLTEDSHTAAVLAPLRETVGRVARQVEGLERDRVHQFAAVQAALQHVEAGTSELRKHTSSLAGSLNASSVRGAWGEVQLRRVLEHAGLLPRCDFDEQVSAISRHEASIRPDAVMRLPGGKVLVIDSKAPMSAFLKAQADDIPASARTELLAEHAAGLKRHVTQLAGKQYWSAFDATPEMVVCFVATEAMLSAALAADPGLHESAMASKVVLVGPGSLMALARTVAFTWQQEALTENAKHLMGLGQELYRRLSTLGGHTTAMGRRLQAAVESYNQFVGTLESRVLVTARRMHDLQIVDAQLPKPQVLEGAPRVLTAVELTEPVTSPDACTATDTPLVGDVGTVRSAS